MDGMDGIFNDKEGRLNGIDGSLQDEVDDSTSEKTPFLARRWKNMAERITRSRPPIVPNTIATNRTRDDLLVTAVLCGLVNGVPPGVEGPAKRSLVLKGVSLDLQKVIPDAA